MGCHPILGFGIEGGARWQRLRNLPGGKLKLECVCVMPVVCVCVSVCPEWQLTRPHSWSLWGASLCWDPAAGTLLPPCLLALAGGFPVGEGHHLAHRCHIGRAKQGEAGCEVEGICAAAVGGTVICIRRVSWETPWGSGDGLARCWGHLLAGDFREKHQGSDLTERLKFPRKKANSGSSARSAWEDRKVSGSFPAAGETGMQRKAWLEDGGVVMPPQK